MFLYPLLLIVGEEMRLLILSDVHYPIGSMDEVKKIIRKTNPDDVAFLGDNIDPRNGEDAVAVYRRFVALISGVFPISRTILMLGDGDYLFQGKKGAVLRYVNSLKTANADHLVYRKGNMVFSHGNVERSRHLERMGKSIVEFSVSRRIHRIIPVLVAFWARMSLHARRGDYLFLGHIHFLGKSEINRTTFCGTLNRNASYFAEESLGYVIVEHEHFTLDSMDSIHTVGLNLPAASK